MLAVSVYNVRLRTHALMRGAHGVQVGALPGKRYKGMMTPEERRALGIIILSLMQCNGFEGSRVFDLRVFLKLNRGSYKYCITAP